MGKGNEVHKITFLTRTSWLTNNVILLGLWTVFINFLFINSSIYLCHISVSFRGLKCLPKNLFFYQSCFQSLVRHLGIFFKDKSDLKWLQLNGIPGTQNSRSIITSIWVCYFLCIITEDTFRQWRENVKNQGTLHFSAPYREVQCLL